MGKEDYISITHFINPQLFWYHKIDVQTEGFKELQRIEESVQLLYTAKQSAALVPYRPVVGEVVAIAFLSWNKFIRARVEYIAEYTKAENEYVVWALDYGFPFSTKRTYIRKLPELYAAQTDHIRKGGIANIIPADVEFDFLTTSNKVVKKISWPKRPVELLEKVINDAASISFVESFATNGGPSDTQYFGDLKIVNHLGVEFMASDYLLRLDTAIKCTEGFKEELANLKTARIPYWQTNSGDMKIVENKLNSFNVAYAHQGNFNLSATLSDSSCDNFAKQKVMDWCQRNQNVDRPEEDRQPFAPLNDLDTSDISFDDSVSVNNYKEQGLHVTHDDTFMGCAGALNKGRKKKYEGKQLPPKPSLEVFEVIAEHKSISAENRGKENLGEGATSALNDRTKALLELRKKHQKQTRNEKNIDKQSGKEDISQKLDALSDTGTAEFLQICKEINAHSTRMARLKELRKHRVESSCGSSEGRTDTNSVKEDISESCDGSVKSSRVILLQQIKQKHSKQFVPQKVEDNLMPNQANKKENLGKQAESVVSSHAAKLISLRKKVKEKTSQELQKPDQVEKEENTSNQAESVVSSHAAKLISLRKKIKEKTSQELQKPDQVEKEENTSNQAESVVSSHAAKLISLRKKIKEKTSQELQKPDQVEKEENTSNQAESVVSSHAAKLISLRKKVKEKTSQKVLDQVEKEENTSNHAESVVSSHAAKLISLRKKIKEKNSQEAELVPEIESKLKNLVVGDRSEEAQELQRETQISAESGALGHDTERASSATHTEKNASNQFEEQISQKQEVKLKLDPKTTSGVDFTSTVSSLASSKVSGAREAELLNMRKMIHSNPFQVMTMVPGGYDVTKLVKYNNEEEHWHTKKTTLDDFANSSRSSTGSQNNNRSKDSSSQGRVVARRTEDIEAQNFRLTRSPKERKKSNTIGEEKNLLDASLISDLVPPPTILPKAVTPERTMPDDEFFALIENETSFTNDEVKTPIYSCKEEKLLNLSDANESKNANLADINGVSLIDLAGKEVSSLGNAASKDLINLESPQKPIAEVIGTVTTKNQEELFLKSSITVETRADDFPTSALSHDTKLTSNSSSSSAVSMQRLLRSSLRDNESDKVSVVGSCKQSSSSSTCSFIKINSYEIQDTSHLPPITSKWKDSVSVGSSSFETTKLEKVSPQPLTPLQSSVPNEGGYLAKNESNIHLPQVAGESSLKTNLIEHLVLAHSHTKVSPIENMTSAMFAPVVHKEMENMRLTKMYRIQSYAWAHLIRGNSFFVVNPARTGKSWCYLPPICSMVNYRLESNELPQSYGPVAVIIAPTSVQVENISRQCRRLLASSTTKISVVASYTYRNSMDVKIELHNGCGILVITPPSLRRLLVASETESLLNMERIQFVILDDVDMMISQGSEFSETLHKFFGPVLRQECGKLKFQLVVTSKRWTRQMVELMKISSQPMLCIGDFLEAAVYAKAKISIKLQSETEKMSVMMKFLQTCCFSVERVVIVCNSMDEVDEVERDLVKGGLACLSFTERTPVEYQNLIHEWKIKAISQEILITMDSVLPELMIQNATILIHFSLPKSWTKFNFRFSVFLQKHHNLIKNAFDSPTEFVRSVILLDENNNAQLPRLIEFMKHHDQSKYIHPSILNVADRVTADREWERVKNEVLMCPKVLEFGSCDERSRCTHRHQLTKNDMPRDDIPTEGDIRLKILEVLSPTHYIARLLTQKIEGTWKVIRRSNEVTRFLMQMLLHFTSDSAQVTHWPLRANDMCVYKSDDAFHRCRILEVPPIVYENIVRVVNVKIKLIDSGTVITCNSNSLLVIPENFMDFPAQAVDIRLSCVKPFDNERVWDTRCTRTVKNWIMTEVGENDSLQASIDFALMDTIWVKNVLLIEKLPTIRGYALKVNVKRSLIGKEFAVSDDDNHVVKSIAQQKGLLKSEQENLSTTGKQDVEDSSIEENLMEFSRERIESIDSDESSHKDLTSSNLSEPVEVLNEPREEWMQLNLDRLTKIEFYECKDPEQFFVCLSKGEDFQDLELLIKEHKKVPLEGPHLMQNCLAPYDGAYHRAKILRLEVNSADEKVRARVFFCDLGIFRNLSLSKLLCSSKELIEFLPFQAISCKLTGILCSLKDKVNLFIPKLSCAYFANAVKDISKFVVLDEDFPIHSYEIVLYECAPNQYDVQVNKMLVDQGWAKYDVETKHFLESDTKAIFTKADGDCEEEPTTFDFEQLLEHMQSVLDDMGTEKRSKKEQQLIKNTEKPAQNNDQLKQKEDTIIDTPKTDQRTPALKSLYVCPQTTWYETMCMIYLVIHAPDVTDYYLEVTPKRLMYSASVHGKLQVLVLDFLGYVEPEQLTHEIRGLNVVVRLVKGVYMKWPRLLETSAKYPWLTYNLDAIDMFQAEQLIDDLKSNQLTSTSSESSESSCSSNPCETLNIITNFDKLFDPMEEIF